MTEDEARKVLAASEESQGPYIDLDANHEARLDGLFTIELLEAVITLMRFAERRGASQ